MIDLSAYDVTGDMIDDALAQNAVAIIQGDLSLTINQEAAQTTITLALDRTTTVDDKEVAETDSLIIVLSTVSSLDADAFVLS